MNVYSKFAARLKRIYRAFHRGYRLAGFSSLHGPAVYIIHHQNMSGPVHALGLLPGEARIWAFHVFLKKSACFDQFYGYTLTKRFHWPKFLAWPVAKLLSIAVPAVLNGFGAIPVYHSTGVFSTMRQSLMALEKGESLIICPDVEYSSSAAAVGDVYTGYLGLEKLYNRQCGGHLQFVPLYCSKTKKVLAAGTPVVFRTGRDFKAESARVSATLRTQINLMGTMYGDVRTLSPVFTPGGESVLKI